MNDELKTRYDVTTSTFIVVSIYHIPVSWSTITFFKSNKNKSKELKISVEFFAACDILMTRKRGFAFTGS